MRLDLSRLRGNPEAPLLMLDLFMVLLVFFNLAWLLFNTLFASQLFQSGIAWVHPGFHAWYREEIFPDFLEYDLLFVAIYLAELVFRWLLAIHRRTYHRWFFYPFVHWYDVLGCIPMGSFRWLRVLRVVSLLWRLQQNAVIDLSKTWLVRTARKYLDVVTEEVADRVVINVLDGVHTEIERGNPVVHRIGREVLAPRSTELIDWLAARIQAASASTWQANRVPLQSYLSDTISDGMAASTEMRRLQTIPVVGPAIREALDEAIADIANGIVERIAADIADPSNRPTLKDALQTAADAMIGDEERLARLVREVLMETLIIVKQQVGVQEWKQREAEGFYD